MNAEGMEVQMSDHAKADLAANLICVYAWIVNLAVPLTLDAKCNVNAEGMEI